MFYPKDLQPFVEFSKFLVESLDYIDEASSEFTTVLHEAIDKLKPYVESSFPLIIDIYSKPFGEMLSNDLTEIETVEESPKSLEEIREFLEQFKSEEFVESLFPDNKVDFKSLVEEEFPELLAILHTSLMNIKSYMQEKASINQLIKNYLNGDEDSLFAAIRVDRMVERVPVIADRISLAETLSDEVFLSRLSKCRNKKRDDARSPHKKLNFFLMLFFSFGILQTLTEMQCAEIFINELDSYQGDEESLKKYILRWKKVTNRYIRRIEIKSNIESKT